MRNTLSRYNQTRTEAPSRNTPPVRNGLSVSWSARWNHERLPPNVSDVTQVVPLGGLDVFQTDMPLHDLASALRVRSVEFIVRALGGDRSSRASRGDEHTQGTEHDRLHDRLTLVSPDGEGRNHAAKEDKWNRIEQCSRGGN